MALPAPVFNGFLITKKVYFVSTPQQTTTLNQISLFWEGLARTNPNPIHLPTLFYNLYLQVKHIQTHSNLFYSKLLLENSSIVNFPYPY